MTLDPVALLRDMLALPSLSGREGACVAWFVATANQLGFRATRDGAGNFVAEMGDGPTTHVLLGHIDTVPGEISVRIEKGELWGRGAADAKGPLAAFFAAAHRVGVVPGHRIVVIGAVEEEAASSRGAWFVRDRYSPANTIIGEPSGSGAITLGYKGRLLARFEVTAAKAHSSIPRPTPVERVVAVWETVREHARATSTGKSIYDQLQASLDSVITAGTPFETRVRAVIGFRLPLDCDIAALKQLIEEACAREEARVSFEGEVAAFRAAKNTPVVKAFLASMRGLGIEPGFKVKTGTSDLNVVGPGWGPSVAVYGPGDAAFDHTPDERIAIAEYLRGIDVLEAVLRRLTGAGGA